MKKDVIEMSLKDRKRMVVLENVIKDLLTLKEASKLLGISYRHAIRLKHGYLENGAESLVHKSKNKPSKRRIDSAIRDRAIALYKKHYLGFGPTLAAEKMEEDYSITLNAETLRLWLIQEGLWTRQRKRSKHRSRRERKKHFGEMLQFDGSPHDWFEGRRSKCCLMNMIDDATNTNYCLFSEEETTEAAMKLLYGWIKKYGIPQSLYCDKKNAYVIFREPTLEEQLRGITEPKTHFGKACEKLGIEIIVAHSPQAKGRIERSNGIHQDRLIKEMRLKGISSIDEANGFLKTYYLGKHNRKFSRKPKDKLDLHLKPKKKIDYKNIFAYEYQRTVSNDYIIKFETREFQILKTNKVLPPSKAKVIVRKWLDNTVHIFYKDKELKIEEKELDILMQVC